MKVIIPAAGYATRLYPLTLNKPKHLISVRGQPILNHIVRKVEELEDVDGVSIVTNDKYFQHFQKWSRSFQSRVSIQVFNDGTRSNEDRLGQIGDIHFVLKNNPIDDDLLVIAGDNLFNFSLKDVHRVFHEKRTNINALYDVQSLAAASQLGIASIKGSQIVEFDEKPAQPKSTLASMGIYLFPKENVQLISQYLEAGNNADKMGYFMQWLIQNHDLHGHVYTEKWFDIGWHDSLKQARREFRG